MGVILQTTAYYSVRYAIRIYIKEKVIPREVAVKRRKNEERKKEGEDS